MPTTSPAPNPILVFRTDLLRQLGLFQGYTLDVDHYAPRLLAPGASVFMPRAEAETDENYKQIIAYVVLQHREQVLCYTRGRLSGESKLVAKQSIGFGGHVEVADLTLFSEPGRLAQDTAVREVREELGLAADERDLSLVGLVNDDSDAVGRVHFGFVYVLRLHSTAIPRRERQITQVRFISLPRAKASLAELEGWSRIVVDLLLDPRLAARDGG